MNYSAKRLLSLSVTLTVLLQLLLIFPMGKAYATTQDISGETDQTQITDETVLPDNPLKVQSETTEPPLTYINNIVIFTRFQGFDEYITETGMQNAQANFNTGANSLKQYISTMSYGALTVESSFFPKDTQGNVISYQLPHTKDYYLENPDLGKSRYQEDINAMLMDPVIKSQIEATFTADQLDTNKDGSIDSVMIVYAGQGGYWGSALWPSYLGNQQFTNGLSLQNKIQFQLIRLSEGTSLSANNSGTIIHEFLHRLGLPDLYRHPTETYKGEPVGIYDIMASNSFYAQNLLQYQQRNVLGWGTPIDEFTSGGQFTLKLPEYQDKEVDGGGNNTPETAIILKSPYSSKEFFVVEYRGHQAFDENASYTIDGQKKYLWETGLLIYRINTIYDSNSSYPDYIYIFRPGEKQINKGEGNISQATLSYANDRTSYGKDVYDEIEGIDNETIYFSNGSNSGIEITLLENENSSNNTISFNVTFHSKGTGTLEDPYLISSIYDFNFIGQHSSSNFKIVKDLDAKNISFQPVTLYGSLDGNGHKIYDLNFDRGYITASTGLFSSVGSNALVKNLTLENCHFKSSRAACGMIAGNNFGTLENIGVIGGSVESGNSEAGGIVGYSRGSLKHCYSSADVKGYTAGGLVGINFYYGTIYNSLAAGTVSGINSNSLMGGIVGDNTVYDTPNFAGCDNCYWIPSLTGQTTGAMGQSYVDGKTPTDGMQKIIMSAPIEITSSEPVQLPIIQLEQNEIVINSNWNVKDYLFAPVRLENNTIIGLRNSNSDVIVTFTINEYDYTINVPVSVSDITEPQFIFTAQLDSLVAVFNGIAARIYETGNHKVYLYDGTTVTPLRVVSECAGLIVDYDDATGNTIVTNPHTGEYIIIKLGDTSLKKYSSDGTVLGSLTMAVAPMVVSDRTYVPMRAVSEAFGYQVYYREHTDGYNYVTLTNRNPAFTDDEITALCDDAACKIAAYKNN